MEKLDSQENQSPDYLKISDLNPKNAVEAYISNQHPNESVNLAVFFSLPFKIG